MPKPKSLTVRLGTLAAPLARACKKRKITPSELIRIAIAKELDEPVPEMKAGNPKAGKQAKKAARARWGK